MERREEDEKEGRKEKGRQKRRKGDRDVGRREGSELVGKQKTTWENEKNKCLTTSNKVFLLSQSQVRKVVISPMTQNYPLHMENIT